MTKEGFIGQFVIDSTIRNSPSFHFGVKHKEKLTTAQLTPGPAAYFPENKTYNTGREAKRAPLIISRKSPFKAPKNPGPADYLPGSCALLSQHPSTPCFSIPRASHIPMNKSKTPAPNVYKLDPMLGSSVRSDKRSTHGFSIRSRSCLGGFSEDRVKTPGPAAYQLPNTNHYMRRSACFSITGRHFMPNNNNTTKPGPASHFIGHVPLSTQRKSPSFSFGIRHSNASLPTNFNDF